MKEALKEIIGADTNKEPGYGRLAQEFATTPTGCAYSIAKDGNVFS